MKTTRYTLLAAALLLAASCANDPVEDIINPSAPGTALPGGTFVIDYAAGMEGADTRLAASERIQSLDYLIYQSDSEDGTYTLLKKRSIPDINETTTWPLTRKDMTWEQREALKDTLSTSHYYKMVFVANADDDIWDPAGTSGFHALQNVEEGSDFNEGRLVLPPNGQFEDDNMYYMATLAVDGTKYGTEEDKEGQTASLPIMLKRMVNKVEVKLADDVVNGIQEKRSVDEYVESKLGEYYDSYYDKTDYTGELDKVVWSYMDVIKDKITNDTHDINNRESRSKEAFKTKFILPDDKRKAVVTSISKCTDGCTSDNYCVKHQFIAEMKSYFSTRCDWSNISNLILTYDASSASYASAMSFNKEVESKTNATTIQVEKNTKGQYIFYSFRNKANSEINKISSISFRNSNGEEVFQTTCGIIPGNETTDGNTYCLLTYYPISFENISLCTDEESTFAFTRDQYNIQDVLQWEWDDSSFEYTGSADIANTGWKQFKMIKWVNSLFCGSDENQESFEPYTLTLNIHKVEIVHPWNTTVSNNN